MRDVQFFQMFENMESVWQTLQAAVAQRKFVKFRQMAQNNRQVSGEHWIAAQVQHAQFTSVFESLFRKPVLQIAIRQIQRLKAVQVVTQRISNVQVPQFVVSKDQLSEIQVLRERIAWQIGDPGFSDVQIF